jgi:hypothetical protein
VTKSIRNYLSQKGGSQIINEGVEGPGKATYVSYFSLPKEWNTSKRQDFNMEQYKKYLRLINLISKEMEVKNAHFIQPVPAINKQLSEEEIKVVGDLSYGAVYMNMTVELLELNDEDIPVFSLLDVFENVNESIYSDEFHAIRDKEGESLGYKMIAEKIASELEIAWNLKRK